MYCLSIIILTKRKCWFCTLSSIQDIMAIGILLQGQKLGNNLEFEIVYNLILFLRKKWEKLFNVALDVS